MMKRVILIYITLIISVLTLMLSCSGQYDNIDQYATEETVYVGKFSDYPYITIGYKRVEIELMGEYVGRVYADDIYLGKGKKTVVEYEEPEGVRRIEFDSICSWVNITGLTIPKTYVFSIYAEDEAGHRSIPVEALGKPFTDDDLAGFAFPVPHVIPSPSTVEFVWDDVSMGLSSPLYRFIELVYSYVDKDNKTVSGKLTARDVPSFSVKNLNMSDSTAVTVSCRVIPIMDSKQIIDTISMVRDILTTTVSTDDYLAARELRPIVSALVDPFDETKATVTLGKATDHLQWTEIRYRQKSTGMFKTERDEQNIENTKIECTDIVRGEKIQIRCAFQPPTTDLVLLTAWTDYEPFILKYDMKTWVVIPKDGSHNWGADGAGSQTLWSGGHPMLILDDDPGSGWHSILDADLPNVLVVDMQETKKISRIYIGDGSYWMTVQLYLTDDPAIDGYATYPVDWDAADRQTTYGNNMSKYYTKIPATVPESWGSPYVFNAAAGDSHHTFAFSPPAEKRFMIIRFPNSSDGKYISVKTLEVYSD
jgi:hypothetical protein